MNKTEYPPHSLNNVFYKRNIQKSRLYNNHEGCQLGRKGRSKLQQEMNSHSPGSVYIWTRLSVEDEEGRWVFTCKPSPFISSSFFSSSRPGTSIQRKKTDGCLHLDPAQKLPYSSLNCESESMGDCQLVTISEAINKLDSISYIVSRPNAML